ncbi:hypothetical protein NLI96_g4570 [Meripilus lineatus]|uniref:Uncharacterized protein n=1 Tax=Meripilus lineatus TaxID=2056292 RepID=A0AAD5V4M7_9APHY|nr:hypothetical protein NLI96_g4570 [Physisporinus lineatus]
MSIRNLLSPAVPLYVETQVETTTTTDFSKEIKRSLLHYVEKAQSLLQLLEKHDAVITGTLPLYILLRVFGRHTSRCFPRTIEICIPKQNYTQFLVDFASLYKVRAVTHSSRGWTEADSIIVTMCNRHIHESDFVKTIRNTWRLIRCGKDDTDITWSSKPATHELTILTHNKLLSIYPRWTLEGKTALYGLYRHNIAAETTASAVAKGFLVFDDVHELANSSAMKNAYFVPTFSIDYNSRLEAYFQFDE